MPDLTDTEIGFLRHGVSCCIVRIEQKANVGDIIEISGMIYRVCQISWMQKAYAAAAFFRCIGYDSYSDLLEYSPQDIRDATMRTPLCLHFVSRIDESVCVERNIEGGRNEA
jgi:hypothetical protein